MRGPTSGCTSTDRARNDERVGVLLVVDGYGAMSRGTYVLTVALE